MSPIGASPKGLARASPYRSILAGPMPLICCSSAALPGLRLGDRLERLVGEHDVRRHLVLGRAGQAPLLEPGEELLVVRRGAVAAAADLALGGGGQGATAGPAAGRLAAGLAAGAGGGARRGLRRQPGQEARRLAGASAAGVAGQAPRDRQVLAGAGEPDVEQSPLLLDLRGRAGEGDRDRALLGAADENRVPLEALGGVQGGQSDAVRDRGVLLGAPACRGRRRSRPGRRPPRPRTSSACATRACSDSQRSRAAPRPAGASVDQPMPESVARTSSTRSSPAPAGAGGAAQQRDRPGAPPGGRRSGPRHG